MVLAEMNGKAYLQTATTITIMHVSVLTYNTMFLFVSFARVVEIGINK